MIKTQYHIYILEMKKSQNLHLLNNISNFEENKKIKDYIFEPKFLHNISEKLS